VILRTIEQKIEALVEGIFGRAFRANVQPVELARKLAKEMDDHRTVSVSRVYVPNEYTIYLSLQDYAQFHPYQESLRAELQEYLAEHARREGYALLSPPIVLMTTDADLDLGEFGIATRMVQRRPARRAEEPAPRMEPAATMVYRPTSAPGEEGPPPPVAREVVTLSSGDLRYEVRKPVVLIGRSQECDIRLADVNVSRRHAELRQEGTSYLVVDLDSTNGTLVNGVRVRQAKLEHGDTISLGSTDLVFRRELP